MNDTPPVQLPAHLLARLKPDPEATRSRVDSDAMVEVAGYFGIYVQKGLGGSWWNETIDALDEHYPNWRGYPAPVANLSMAKVLVDRSARDAA